LKKQPKRRFVVRREPKVRRHIATAVLGLVAAIGVVQFYFPGTALSAPFGGSKPPALATPSSNAFGRSREVKLLFTLPGDRVEFPLSVGGDPSTLSYEWTSLRGNESGFATRPMAGADLATPDSAGFYYLTLVNRGERQILQEPIVAVMKPFEAKAGGLLNGYKIGTYLAEKARGRAKETPSGFVEVFPQYLDIPVSKHLRLHHFVTHDEQAGVWPKYAALDPRLLDKLELVFVELERLQGGAGASQGPIELDVNSGYRTPAHNRLVRRAASDSRHQYGDAADVVIDANGNGRIDREDHKLVAAAVETVEKLHPDLAGGMGIYTSPLYPTPYVHIDARGQKVRWRG
jgi:uncharacterized protein YcbK (DUF882 family)